MQTEWKGTLSVSIGETELTVHELHSLKPGDVILTDREAGYPQIVLFNNLPIGLCTIAVFGREGTLGVRIADSDFRPEFRINTERQDLLGELLPVSVRFGSLNIDLTDAVKFRTESYINLGVPSDTEDNADLYVAGIPFAKGQVICSGEMMGIRIVSIANQFPSNDIIRTTGKVADAKTRDSAKTYDFRMPDWFSFNQMERLSAIHSLAARNIEAAFSRQNHILQDLTCTYTDQCNMKEARDLMTSRNLEYSFTAENRTINAHSFNKEIIPAVIFEASDCKIPLREETKKMIKEYSMAQSELTQKSPVYFFIYPDLAKSIISDNIETQKSFLSCFGSGWKKHVDFRLDTVSDNSFDIKLERDMAVVIELGHGKEKPLIGIVYPARTLEPYLQILGR